MLFLPLRLFSNESPETPFLHVTCALVPSSPNTPTHTLAQILDPCSVAAKMRNSVGKANVRERMTHPPQGLVNKPNCSHMSYCTFIKLLLMYLFWETLIYQGTAVFLPVTSINPWSPILKTFPQPYFSPKLPPFFLQTARISCLPFDC